MQINATIDLSHQRATAELSDSTNQLHFVMVTIIPGGESQAVDAVDQAFLSQDWATLYTITELPSSMTEAQFAAIMTQQAQQVGTITSIVVTSSPQVTTGSDGLTSFSVTQPVTYSLNGTSQTKTLTTSFVLDNGGWKLWFSAS